MRQINNYLKSYRKALGLTQRELSFLIGQPTTSSISKFESGACLPDLKTTIYFKILYDCSLVKLWPAHYRKSEYILIERLNQLIEVLSKSKEYKKQVKAS